MSFDQRNKIFYCDSHICYILSCLERRKGLIGKPMFKDRSTGSTRSSEKTFIRWVFTECSLKLCRVSTLWGTTSCSQDEVQGVHRILYRVFTGLCTDCSQDYIQDVHMIRHRVFIGLFRGCSQDEIQGVHRIMHRMFTWWGTKFIQFSIVCEC